MEPSSSPGNQQPVTPDQEEADRQQPNAASQSPESVAGTSEQPSGEEYVSNPLQVFINGIKNLYTLGLGTFVRFIGIVLLTMVVIGALGGLLIFLIHAFGDGQLSTFIQLGTFIVGIVMVLLILAWGIILRAAWEKYTLETARNCVISFGSALRTGYKKAVGLLVVQLLTGVLIFLGLILLIVPGLVFWYWFVFASSVYIDKDIGAIEAMKESKRLVKGKLGELIGLAGVSVVFGLPTAIPLLGDIYNVLVFGPSNTIAWKYRYTSVDMLDAAGLPKPKTHVANKIFAWILVVLIIGGIVLSIALANMSAVNDRAQSAAEILKLFS